MANVFAYHNLSALLLIIFCSPIVTQYALCVAFGNSMQYQCVMLYKDEYCLVLSEEEKTRTLFCSVQKKKKKKKKYIVLFCPNKIKKPEGRPGISHVSPQSGLPGLSVRSHFKKKKSALLFFCKVLSLFLSYPFLLSAHSPDLLFPKPPLSERSAL